jgi:hypothetical protein
MVVTEIPLVSKHSVGSSGISISRNLWNQPPGVVPDGVVKTHDETRQGIRAFRFEFGKDLQERDK